MTLDVSDLINRPYEGDDCCWRIACLVLARLGVEIPTTPAAALASPEEIFDQLSDRVACRPGDVLEIAGDARPHVGVALGPFEFIHATREAGVRTDRIELWERARRIVRRWRPKELL